MRTAKSHFQNVEIFSQKNLIINVGQCPKYISVENYSSATPTAKKKLCIRDFFSKCDQILSFLRIWSHLLKKSLLENYIFWAVTLTYFPLFLFLQYSSDNLLRKELFWKVLELYHRPKEFNNLTNFWWSAVVTVEVFCSYLFCSSNEMVLRKISCEWQTIRFQDILILGTYFEKEAFSSLLRSYWGGRESPFKSKRTQTGREEGGGQCKRSQIIFNRLQ